MKSSTTTLEGVSPETIERAARVLANGPHERTVAIGGALLEKIQSPVEPAKRSVQAWLKAEGEGRQRIRDEIQKALGAKAFPGLQEQLAQLVLDGGQAPLVKIAQKVALKLGRTEDEGVAMLRELEQNLLALACTPQQRLFALEKTLAVAKAEASKAERDLKAAADKVKRLEKDLGDAKAELEPKAKAEPKPTPKDKPKGKPSKD